jgi:hypothetical protein
MKKRARPDFFFRGFVPLFEATRQLNLADTISRAKAPDGWRIPRRLANFGGAVSGRQLLDCGSLLPLSA